MSFHFFSGILFIILLLSLCIVMTFSIYQSITNELYVERSANLNEVSEQIANNINNSSSFIWNMADFAFSHLLSAEIESKEDLPALLAEAESGSKQRPIHLLIIDSKTTYYHANGCGGLWRNVNFLLNSDADRWIFLTTPSFNSQRECMFFMHRLPMPKVLQDGTELTHTALVLTADTYRPFFSPSGFDGVADIFIVHADGRSIYRENKTGTFANNANIFHLLENVPFLHKGSFANLLASFNDAAGASFEFVYEGKRHFISLAPTQMQDWIVALIVPTAQIQGHSGGIVGIVLYKIIFFALLLVWMALMIIYFFVSASNNRMQVEQQKHVNAALKKSADEANWANKSKSEFLSHMSHDIRTPINIIIGMIEIAEENLKNPEKLRQCLDKIASSSKHLYAIITDVLDMSKLENGKMPYKENEFVLRSVLETCCSIIQTSAQQQNIAFTCNYADLTHSNLVGSDLYLRKILMNILSNAVKFTGDGGHVSFEATELSCDGKTSVFRFVIQDDGIGMSEEYQKHLFDPFSQEGISSRTKYEGSGLGMPIAKSLLDKIGGTMEVDSKLGQGSRFTITIPFAINTATAQSNDTALTQTAPYPLQGMRILLVEDNALNLEIAEHFLRGAGAEVVPAANGEEAVKLFENSAISGFDVVLMDLMMPVMDGLTAARTIRSLNRPDAAEIPIIAMTANVFTEDIERTKAAGMNEHLSKPIKSTLLISTVSKYKKAF